MKKMALKILKRNFQILKNDFNVYTDKFLIEMKEEGGALNYEIEQNFNSFPLLWSSLFYPTPASCFFLELVNLFGKLEINTNIPYSSFSQSLTTYCLKMLARKNVIKIEKHGVSIYGTPIYRDLDNYENIFGTQRNKERLMYTTFFYKVRELTLEDLPLLKSVAKMLQIDFFIYDVEEKDGKLFLSLKEKEKMKNIVNGKMLRNLLDQRENIDYFLSQLKEQIFYKVFDEEEEQKKRTRKK